MVASGPSLISSYFHFRILLLEFDAIPNRRIPYLGWMLLTRTNAALECASVVPPCTATAMTW